MRSRTTHGRGARLALGAAMVLLGGAGALAGRSPAGAASGISVQQSPLPGGGACVPALFGRARLRRTVESTPQLFRLTVVNHWTFCEPVVAVAVVYAMPSTGGAWPQRLASTREFTIAGPSTTVITFAKGCEPAQFDVVTGATPAVIDLPPAGPLHGPLLFPGDLATAEQYPGTACAGTGPPTTPASTVPPPGATVAPTTTVPVPSTSTYEGPTAPVSSTTPVRVAGETASAGPSERATSGAPALPGSGRTSVPGAAAALAVTGTEAGAVAGLGVLLVLVGLGSLGASRARRPRVASWTIRPGGRLFSTHPTERTREAGPRS